MCQRLKSSGPHYNIYLIDFGEALELKTSRHGDPTTFWPQIHRPSRSLSKKASLPDRGGLTPARSPYFVHLPP
jgi:hypothetical protein